MFIKVLLLLTMALTLISTQTLESIDLVIPNALNQTEVRNLIVGLLNSIENTSTYDKEMLDHVINNYLDKLSAIKVSDNGSIENIDQYFKKELVKKEVDEFLEHMTDELIKSYGLEPKSAYAAKMKKDPETYGLTFKAYKILSKTKV